MEAVASMLDVTGDNILCGGVLGLLDVDDERDRLLFSLDLYGFSPWVSLSTCQNYSSQELGNTYCRFMWRAKRSGL
jgi:hypothetical protein